MRVLKVEPVQDSNTGIIPIARNEAGLATVLGHEMAHATSRHSAERIFRSDLTKTMIGGVQQSLSQMDPNQRQVFYIYFINFYF